MAWFWTDDLARLLIETGRATESAVQDWLTRPVGVVADDGSDPLEVAAGLLGAPGQSEVA